MTLAITAAPLNNARRDMSVSGTRAVVSSQQLMSSSKCRREIALQSPEIRWSDAADVLLLLQRRCPNAHARIVSALATIERCCADDMPQDQADVQCIIILSSHADQTYIEVMDL